MNGLAREHETDEVSEVKFIRIKCDPPEPVFVNKSISLSHSLFLPALSAETSTASCQHMPRKAICLFSLCRMSESTRGKMRGRDKVTGVAVRAVILEAISQMLLLWLR